MIDTKPLTGTTAKTVKMTVFGREKRKGHDMNSIANLSSGLAGMPKSPILRRRLISSICS